MNVRELKKLIEGLDDNTVLVRPCGDHSYTLCRLSKSTALYDTDGTWSEDHGEIITPEYEYGERLPVLIVH